MTNSTRPQLNWRAWLAGGALVLAVFNCAGAYRFNNPPPFQPELVYYWPYLFYGHQGLLAYVCPSALAVMLVAILIVRQLRARVRGLHNVAPVVTLLGLAASACLCFYSAMAGEYYQHITSVQTATRSYQLGVSSEVDIYPIAGLVLCGCDRLGFACRCHPVGWFEMGSDTPPRLVPLAVGGVAVYQGDHWLTSWLDAEP